MCGGLVYIGKLGQVCLRPGLGRPCVETELAATEKSATDGD